MKTFFAIAAFVVASSAFAVEPRSLINSPRKPENTHGWESSHCQCYNCGCGVGTGGMCKCSEKKNTGVNYHSARYRLGFNDGYRKGVERGLLAGIGLWALFLLFLFWHGASRTTIKNDGSFDDIVKNT